MTRRRFGTAARHAWMKALATSTAPILLVSADLDQPWPDLTADERYRDAWVVLKDAGVPGGIVEIDLGADPTSQRALLDEESARIRSSRWSAGSAPDDVHLPSISVIVPTIGERLDELERCLESLDALDYPNFEIVLVDNRRGVPSPDPLAALASRARLRVVRAVRPGISAARNEGVAHANGEVVAFTDDDVCVDVNWLRAIGTRMVREPDVDAVSGLVLPAELDHPAQVWYERYVGGFGGPRSFAYRHLEADGRGPRCLRARRFFARDAAGQVREHPSIYGVGAYVAGANMAMRPSALERIGGFDEALGTGTRARGGEDLAAIISLLMDGGRMAYEPAAFVFHRHRRDYAGLLAQMDGSGVGFGAMLTSLILRDPCHLVRLASLIIRAGVRTLVRARTSVRGRRTGERAPAAPTFPPQLFWHEIRGYLRGPFAYAASRRALAMRRARPEASPGAN
ncbi:MAG TPA: glycosyltransferase [Acidimicrobiales bacterium]|nr:glycosyltransferase [Acidimicrobiales bacterium]